MSFWPILPHPMSIYCQRRQLRPWRPICLYQTTRMTINVFFKACRQLCEHAWHFPSTKIPQWMYRIFTNYSTALRNTSTSNLPRPAKVILPRRQKKNNATIQELLHVGTQHVEFGFGTTARSLPLAIAVSLLPTVLSDYEFMALLAHCCCPRTDAARNDLPPPPITTETVDTLFSHVRENQAHWNCYDAPASTVRQALEQFTLLPADTTRTTTR